MLKITTILMDYETTQTGITHMPQFGWKLDSDKRNVMQEAYELEISKEENFSDCIYKSGKIMDNASSGIMPENVSLESVTKYFVRVKSYALGEVTDWARTHFVTGLMDNAEWKADFITAENDNDADNSKGTYVRKGITLKKNIKEAYACTTALGLYNFYINGKKVGEDELTPGWTSYRKHLCYQTYDVTDYLTSGDNVIGAMLAAGWYKGKMGFEGLERRRNHYGKKTAFLAQILIRYEDGTTETVLTDNTWEGADSPVIFAEIYDGEIYDANKEIKGWSESVADSFNWRRVAIETFEKSVLVGQGSGKVSKIDEIPAKEIFTTPEGDKVIDFGQNMTGHVRVECDGKAGDVIEIACFEILDAAGNVYLDNLRGAKESIKYTFAEDKHVLYEPSFTFMGFRYAKIVSFPGEAKLENFTGVTTHSKMDHIGSIECSNADINQLAHNILWGLKGNFVDVPTDCPQRDERLGWTGDAQIFCRTACSLMNTYSFYRKWLRDVEADQTPEGGVAHVVPDIISGNEGDNWLLKEGSHSAAAWADVAVINPWTMHLIFGDNEILRIQYNSMKKWINFMREHSNDYIWNYKLQFGDWVALDAEEGSYFGATPNDLTCTAYFAYSTKLFIKAAKALGIQEDIDEYSKLYDKIVEKFQNTFFNEDGSMTAETQTAHIVALYFDLTPEKFKEKTVKKLLELLDKENGHLVTGFVGTPYFCHALSQNGHTKEAYDLLLKDDFPSWLYQVKMGATTVWEHWDGIKPDGTMWSPDMNSFNHYAYGAIGEWIIRVAAGLEVDEEKPGYKHSVIYPRIGGNLAWLGGKYGSVYGEVASRWEVVGDEVILSVKVPANTTATIILDQAKSVKESDGLEFVSDKVGMKAEAGSGEYRIVFTR